MFGVSGNVSDVSRHTEALRELIVGLYIVKNEADIIEPMVRHNLAFLDRLHVVDYEGSDGTIRIPK